LAHGVKKGADKGRSAALTPLQRATVNLRGLLQGLGTSDIEAD